MAEERRPQRRRAADHSWIMRARENGTGQWMLGFYRVVVGSGALSMLLAAVLFYGDVKRVVTAFDELNLAVRLERIDAFIQRNTLRLDRIENWIDREADARRPGPPT